MYYDTSFIHYVIKKIFWWWVGSLLILGWYQIFMDHLDLDLEFYNLPPSSHSRNFAKLTNGIHWPTFPITNTWNSTPIWTILFQFTLFYVQHFTPLYFSHLPFRETDLIMPVLNNTLHKLHNEYLINTMFTTLVCQWHKLNEMHFFHKYLCISCKTLLDKTLLLTKFCWNQALTTIFPKFCPCNIPMKAWGRFSKPCWKVSLLIIFPSSSHDVICFSPWWGSLQSEFRQEFPINHCLLFIPNN